MIELYSIRDVARILALQESRLRYWTQVGFIGPTVRKCGRFYYTFRDLVAVWPDHAEARAGLIEAVFGEARAYKRKRNHAQVLALADELLNLDPGDFQALLLRADALLALRRYAEAKQAYRECMKIKPRHKEVNKNFWKAATLARKSRKPSRMKSAARTPAYLMIRDTMKSCRMAVERFTQKKKSP